MLTKNIVFRHLIAYKPKRKHDNLIDSQNNAYLEELGSPFLQGITQWVAPLPDAYANIHHLEEYEQQKERTVDDKNDELVPLLEVLGVR